MPNIPEMTEVWTGAENMVINAASGKDTPKQAADKATKQIQQAIKQKIQRIIGDVKRALAKLRPFFS